jgi:hypothetical protein
MTEKKKTIIIQIYSTQVGFWLSVAKVLSSKYSIIIVTKEKESEKRFFEITSEDFFKVESTTEFFNEVGQSKLDQLDVITEARDKEIKYGETFSMIISHDRGMGKGYIVNALKHPDIIRSWWSHTKKVKEVLKDFLFWEYIFDCHSPHIILGSNLKVVSLVARKNNIPCLGIDTIRYGSRVFWIDNEYYQNSFLIENIKLEISKIAHGLKLPKTEYLIDQHIKHLQSKIKYDYITAFKKVKGKLLREAEIHIKAVLRGNLKAITEKTGYKFGGWVKTTLRIPGDHEFFKKYGKKPEDLNNFSVVYFPLHMEPEISLLNLSPEFNNSMELLIWVSKSLPVDTFLVVKEHPDGFGLRGREWYNNLRRISNVVLAKPEVNSWDWIKASKIIVTITGTTAFEAVHMNRPVISYGRHQLVNCLPTVRYAYNYETTKSAIDHFLNIKIGDRIFDISRTALYQAQLNVSFDMPCIEKLNSNRELDLEQADIALQNLQQILSLAKTE